MMELTLDRYDLKEEHRGLNPSETKFSHFKLEVQETIGAAGQALYKSDGCHNAIYAPKTPKISTSMKDISIRGRVPFNLHLHKPMCKLMGLMLSPAFGINMGYENFRPTYVENESGKIAYYPFWISGNDEVTCTWINELLQALVDCGAEIERCRVEDVSLDQVIKFDIPTKTPRE